MKFSHLESSCSNLSSQDCRLEPSVRLLRYYRDSHLLSASDTIICPSAESQLSSVLPVLESVSQSNVKVGSLTGDRQDEEAEWWTALLRCGALWCANKMSEAQLTYPEIDKLPVQYQVVAVVCIALHDIQSCLVCLVCLVCGCWDYWCQHGGCIVTLPVPGQPDKY